MKIEQSADGEDTLAKANRTEQVYEQIVDLLISGELRPGDVIVERKMAERLNASRTPIREALGRLEAERLVYKQIGRGVTVSPFSTEAFVEILNVRCLLEGEAAYLAAGNLSPERIAQIRSMQALLDATENPSPTQIWETDDLLHSAIAEAAGNELMADMIRDLRRRTHVFNAFRNPLTGFNAAASSVRLIDLVAAGDAEGSRAEMQAHINGVKQALVARLVGAPRA